MIFNSTEREGVLVMLLLITGLIVIPRFVRSGKPAFFLLPEVINIEKDSLRPVSHREISPPFEYGGQQCVGQNPGNRSLLCK